MITIKDSVKFLLLFVLVIIYQEYAIAQDFENYVPLKCSGKVPDDFKKNATDKYLAELKKIEKSKENNSQKVSQKQFSLNTNFQVNELLFSGRVLFGDPTAEYVNKVADVLLENDKELRKKLRFYIIKSDVVNAFTTHQGIIFINLGLLAQVNSEAELAFVLSHEIGHYVKNHVLEGYLEKEKIKKGQGSYKSMGIDERVEELFKYSKENESDADAWGFELYKKSAYSLKAINPLFDVLLYSYLPFDEIEFNFNFIEDKYFKLPKKYILAKDKIKDITAKEDANDKESTHPNIRKRKENIEDLIKDEKDNKNEKLYIVGESDFLNVQKLARFEVCHIYLTVGKYAKALYSGWLLQQLYPERKYSDKVILMALYGLCKTDKEDESLNDNNVGSKSDDDENEDESEEGTWKSIEGNSQPVYYFLHKLTDRDLTVLATGMAYKVKSKYPDDEFVISLTKDLINDLVSNDDLTVKSFDFESIEIPKVDSIDSSSSDKLTKADKIKKKKKKKKTDEEEEENKKFWKNVFMSLSDKEKSDIKKEFKACIENKEERGKITFEERELKKKLDKKEYEKVQKYGAALGIDKIIMMNPEYIFLDKKGYKYNQNLLKSERGIVDTEKMIKEIGKMTGLKLVMLDKKGEDSHILNNININNQIISWITEKLKYDDTSAILFDNQYTNSLIENAGTEYLGITVVRNVPSYINEKRNLNACLMGAGAVFNPLCCAWGLYGTFFGGRGYSQYTFVLFNIRTNKIKYIDYHEIYAKANQETINQLLYNSINGIKRKK
ncbi:MAG: M48 family metallopeptidase [Bacteroidota bacterium]